MTDQHEPTTSPLADRLRQAAVVVILEPELSAWLEEAADASENGMHDVAEYPDDDPDEGPQCVEDCGVCVGEPVALAVADTILAGVPR
ncbi:hypothetical protein OG552_10340 [Streptomyces sp. NBC_01476]|uniref:hypothetical protein n=1 Tax=Streptomyces sp. NBC_01476 TaxID=2903881 RepID=UPI002E30F2C2|nr:hypothetical protein [Streptomyces sp. NBC_01476]